MTPDFSISGNAMIQDTAAWECCITASMGDYAAYKATGGSVTKLKYLHELRGVEGRVC